jgi:hypothetical protein
MSEAEACAEQIHRALPKVKAGTLRIWGEWFGPPYDNWHTIKTCDANGDRLRLDFDQSEKLLVWSPTGLTVDKSTFRVTGAKRVRWERLKGALTAAYCLHFAYYNFCRIDRTLRMTPAMEAWIADNLWDLAELLA